MIYDEIKCVSVSYFQFKLISLLKKNSNRNYISKCIKRILKFIMEKKKHSLLLKIITTVFTLLWLTFFVLISFSKSFAESLDDPSVGMILFFILFSFFTFIFPFAGLYLWFSDNFRLKSKYLIVLVFSLTPWLIVLLISVRDIIIRSLMD